jgi:hypothetical protein
MCVDLADEPERRSMSKRRASPVLEIVMQAHADALPLILADEPRRRQAIVRSVQDRCDVPEFDKCEVGRDAYPAYGHREVGIGSVVVATAWLAFYVIAAIHVVSGN